MIDDKIAAIRRTPLFGSLGEAELRALAERAVERHLVPNEVLFIAGEEARGLYVVAEGAVRAYRVGEDGREQVIHVERAGASLAEAPVFDDGRCPSNVAAEVASTLLFIDKADVRRLCLEHPPIALAALRLLAGRLRHCAELVETLSLREVSQRLARFLLAEAREHGEPHGSGIRVELTQTQRQIAAHIGTVREVVSRAFTRLEQAGLIALNGRCLDVLHEGRLAAHAGVNFKREDPSSDRP